MHSALYVFYEANKDDYKDDYFVHGFCSRITISKNFMLSSICNSSCSIYSNLWAW